MLRLKKSRDLSQHSHVHSYILHYVLSEMHAEKGNLNINKVWVWQVFHILVSNIFFNFYSMCLVVI